MEKIPLTAKGFAKLDAELKKLKSVERPAVIAAIAEAREHGDLSENAEYHAAREKQSFIEGRIRELDADDRPLRGDRPEPVLRPGEVRRHRGASSTRTPTRRRPTRSSASRRPSIEQGLLNLKSPLARALIGKEPGRQRRGARRPAGCAPTRFRAVQLRLTARGRRA